MEMPMPNMTMDMEMEMQSTFYSDSHFEFLFDSWHVDDTGKYVGALFGLFFFSFTLPVLNYLLSTVEKYKNKASGFMPKLFALIAIGLLRFLFVAAGYILMLAVMSYNTGVFLVVSIGISLGFLITPQVNHYSLQLKQEMTYAPEKFLRDPS